MVAVEVPVAGSTAEGWSTALAACPSGTYSQFTLPAAALVGEVPAAEPVVDEAQAPSSASMPGQGHRTHPEPRPGWPTGGSRAAGQCRRYELT